MKKIIFYIFFILQNITYASVEIHFNNLSDMLLRLNGDLGAAKDFYESAEQKKGYLRRKFYPTLSLEAGAERFSTGPYHRLEQPYGSAIININLFNGYRDKLKSDVIDSKSLQKKVEYQRIYCEELARIRTLYWLFLYYQEMEKILLEAIENNKTNLNKAMIRVQRGISTSTDKIEFEQNAYTLEQYKIKNLLQRQNTEREIKSLLGIAEEESIIIKEDFHQHEEAEQNIYQFNPRHHHDFQWIENELLITQLEKKYARNNWLPSIDLYASASQFTQKDRDYFSRQSREDYTIGINLKMNIFDGGHAYIEYQVNNNQIQGLEKSSSQFKKNLETQYKNTLYLLQLTRGQILGAKENIKQSHKYYQNTQKEYERGVKNSIDLLVANQRLMQAKIKLAEILKEHQLTRVELLKIIDK